MSSNNELKGNNMDWDDIKFMAGMVICTVLLIVAIGYGIVLVQEATRQDCAPNYFWSYKELACIPGYRPSELGR